MFGGHIFIEIIAMVDISEMATCGLLPFDENGTLVKLLLKSIIYIYFLRRSREMMTVQKFKHCLYIEQGKWVTSIDFLDVKSL